MKVQFSTATKWRGKEYRKGQKAEVPEGLAYKLIANGLADKVPAKEVDVVVKPKKARAAKKK